MKREKWAIVAIMAVFAVGAAMAGTASAAAVTEAKKWYTGEAGEAEVQQPKNLEASIDTHAEIGKLFRLKGTIGGKELELQASRIHCSGCKIENKEVTGKAGKVAYGSGKLAFTSVVVTKPEKCTVLSESNAEGEVITKALSIHSDWMMEDPETKEAVNAMQFVPVSGTVLATLKIEGEGCKAIAGSYNLVGTLFAKGQHTETFATNQVIVFSPSVQTATGAEVKLGGNKAELTGSAELTVSEAFTSLFFGIK